MREINYSRRNAPTSKESYEIQKESGKIKSIKERILEALTQDGFLNSRQIASKLDEERCSICSPIRELLDEKRIYYDVNKCPITQRRVRFFTVPKTLF